MLSTGVPAKLIRTRWESFKVSKGTGFNSLLTPIEVLVGEPEVTHGTKIIPRTPLDPQKVAEPKMLAKEGQCHGQAPLPERIRIHSKEIIQILSVIAGKNFAAGVYSISFLRPFRILVYYDIEIREWAANLERKYAYLNRISPNDSAIVGGLPVTPNHDFGEDSKEALAKEDSTEAGANSKDESEEKEKYIASAECQKISFSDLWHLLKPGNEVIGQSEKQAYRIIRVTTPEHRVIPSYLRFFRPDRDMAEKPVQIHCVYVDFDGEKLGPVTETFEIPRFDNDKPVTSLPIYPLRFAKETNRELLIKRGEMLLEVIRVKPMYYTGLTLDKRDEVDSQVMVDFAEAMAEEKNKDWKPKIELSGTSTGKSKDGRPEGPPLPPCVASCCQNQIVHGDQDIENKLSEDFFKVLCPDNSSKSSLIAQPRRLGEIKAPEEAPTKEERVVMSYRVFGFVLRSRKWAQLDLTYLKYENKDSSKTIELAFNRLVLPEGHREMVKSLVTQHFRDKQMVTQNIGGKQVLLARNEKSDLIAGKGKGLILLLHGAPGVGKTTTAEGVAELFKKPLFQVTCGDLGTTSKEVEAELEKNFSLASRWDCILLLDEADVFLASRERKDFKRNGLVAVFLRVLEYYAGILFLTTNRVGDFDEAFASRIHMSLHYPDLDGRKTRDVFKLNLDLIREKFAQQARHVFFDEVGILDFAENHWKGNEKNKGLRWNGRQIRNACHTALALAEFEAQGSSLSPEIDATKVVQLSVGHFKTVEKAYDEFAVYLGDVYGMDLKDLAAEYKLRAVDGEQKKLSRMSKRAAQKANVFTNSQNANHAPEGNQTAFEGMKQQPMSQYGVTGNPIGNQQGQYSQQYPQQSQQNTPVGATRYNPQANPQLGSQQGQQTGSLIPNSGNYTTQPIQNPQASAMQQENLGFIGGSTHANYPTTQQGLPPQVAYAYTNNQQAAPALDAGQASYVNPANYQGNPQGEPWGATQG
ncbi:hypothetical protein BGZ57DRAFT_779382 [Hyaloscypha finlandica]|nr:hypothetical protein BGZ57DRAFT_779382 [Hyaloscypha finlandica]